MSRFRWILLPAAVAAACTLLACGGLEDGFDTLPLPAIAVGTPAAACSGAGNAAITLDAVGTRVVENVPVDPPTGLSEDQVQVPGRVTAPVAGQSVYGLLISTERNCPVGAWTEVAPAADGSFVIALSVSNLQEFRVVAVTGPAGASPECGAAGDCYQMDAAGTIVPVSGLSNTVQVRLL